MDLVDLVSASLRSGEYEKCVWSDGQWHSSAFVEQRSNQLAHVLADLGVGPGKLVGICAERSVEMVIGLLGIIKAGGAYVPLDPDYPSDRLGYMIEDSAAPVILTQERLIDRLAGASTKIFCLDGDWGQAERYSAEPPTKRLSQHDMAYVIYTSGSTGQPKGAINSHAAIVNRLRWMQDEYDLRAGDVVVQKTPFSFDVSVWEFFWPLMTRTPLVMAKPRGHLDPGYLANLIEEHGITTLHFVPSMLQIFLEQPGLREKCQSIRTLICSGEALSHELQQRCFERLDTELHNLYGPTEAAVDVTYWHCRRDSDETVVPIGWPVANTQIHILDEQLQPVPDGETGELHIAGVQVGLGYWNKPELTASQFVKDPFSNSVDARMYKTGDLARRRPDGAIEYLGRIDHQVKIRGLRIELGEIESALESIDGVRQAAVLARDFGNNDVRLIAYVCKESGASLDDGNLKSALAASLPDYMLPQYFVYLDEMPISPNGKLDRKKLPEPARPDTDKHVPSLTDPVEQYLASIWAEELGVTAIDRKQRFFDIGGTSLGAARIIARLQKELDEFIYVISVFDAPTIEEYALFLKREYANALERTLGIELQSSRASNASDVLTPGDFEAFEQAIPRLKALGSGNRKKNPPAIFVLAPPRSGTTLLRVMLAGHPQFFAASELQLLGFESMQERRTAYCGKYSLWLEGLLRTTMEIEGLSLEQAREKVEEMEAQDLSTQDCYRWIQDTVRPRMLVDKSPSYATDLLALQKAERDFDNPLYIHLVRHPYAMIRSFVSYHIEQVLYLHEQPYSGRQLAELIWTISHKNITSFLGSVPPERQFRLMFEDLVTNPDDSMRQLCERFGLEFDANLTRPYEKLESKMVDGVHAESIPMGDTRLLERRSIDPAVASAWMDEHNEDFLCDVSRRLAAEIGYEDFAVGQTPDRSAARDAMLSRRAKRRASRGRQKNNA